MGRERTLQEQKLAANALRRFARKEMREHDYEGIRDQDGWETLELTVMANHPALVADYILDQLKEES